jgi:hypothetical protein
MRKYLLLLFCFFHLCTHAQNQGLDTIAAKLDSALALSNKYFKAKGPNLMRSDVIMIVETINKKFNLQMDIPTEKTFRSMYPDMVHKYFNLYDIPYEGRTKSAEKDSIHVMQDFYRQIHSMDMLTAWTMFCKSYPVPDTLGLMLERKLYLGGYEMTHAALQLYELKKHDCLRDEYLDLRIERAKDCLHKLFDDPKVHEHDIDLRLECIAILLYMGDYSHINNKEMNYVLSHQERNGGFKASKEDDETNEHPTVLGLWALAEMRSHFTELNIPNNW